MLTLSRQTVTKVGDRYDPDPSNDDARWMGAAEKYLATVAERQYLVKPDVGWPSDRDNERVAAAFYRRMGAPVPNVVNATIGGIDACAVRILPDAQPIGDGFAYLTPGQAQDVFRGLLLSSLIGDRDRHGYNWIADDTRAYLIDHGLAFASSGTGQISSFATEYVYDMLDAGIISFANMRIIAGTLPVNAAEIAALAWAHVQRDSGMLPEDVRAHFTEYVDALEIDYRGDKELTYTNWYTGFATGEPEPTEPECDCSICRGQDYDPSGMTWHRQTDGEYRWTRRHNPDAPVIVLRNILRCGVDAPKYAPEPHKHRWTNTRGWHSAPLSTPYALDDDGPLARALGYAAMCQCADCYRPAGRMAGKLCPTGHVFPRKVSDVRRNQDR